MAKLISLKESQELIASSGNASMPDYFRAAWLGGGGGSTDPFGVIVDSTGSLADSRMRNMTSPRSNMEIPAHIHTQAQQLSVWIYYSNPLARRIISVGRDYTIGKGIEFQARDPSVDAVLRDFWFDDENDWPKRLPLFAQDLSLLGEQLFTFAPYSDGFLRVQNVNPILISRVVPDPIDRATILQVVLSDGSIILPEGTSQEEIDRRHTLDVIRKQREGSGYLVGDAIFTTVGGIAFTGRGIPDLFSNIDWMDTLDAFLYNTAEKANFLHRFLWDVTYTDGQEDDMKAFAQTMSNRQINPGAINVHNDKVKWDVIQPKLQMDDVSELVDKILGHVYAGAGVSSVMVGNPIGSMGRQASPELNDPILRGFETRQQIIKRAITRFFNYQIDYAKQRRLIPANADTSFDIWMPRVAIRDLQRLGGVMERIAGAIGESIEHETLTKEEGRVILRAAFDELGFGVHLKLSAKDSEESVADSIINILKEKSLWLASEQQVEVVQVVSRMILERTLPSDMQKV